MVGGVEGIDWGDGTVSEQSELADRVYEPHYYDDAWIGKTLSVSVYYKYHADDVETHKISLGEYTVGAISDAVFTPGFVDELFQGGETPF